MPASFSAIDMPVIPLARTPHTPACFVRVREHRSDGFIEFDFAIQDPSLTVELILPEAAFKEFCATHRVRHLSAQEGAQVDADQAKWRYGQPGLTE